MPQKTIRKKEDFAYEFLHSQLQRALDNNPINGSSPAVEMYERGHRILKIGSWRHHFSVREYVNSDTIHLYAEIFERIDGLEILVVKGTRRTRPHIEYIFEYAGNKGDKITKISGKIEFSKESKKFEHIREPWRMSKFAYN